jgi:very-short-patch-repair endonuclease
MSITAVLRVLRTGGKQKDIEQLMQNARQCQAASTKALVLSKTSKPEQMLRDIILQYYSKAVWKYIIERKDKYYWEVDVALLDQKIAFEYDGLYWHNKKRDDLRDQSLQKLGWTVFHFQFYKSPTREQLEEVVLPILHNLPYLITGQNLKNSKLCLEEA